MPQELRIGELKLRSPSVEYHKRIPERHTADGEDVSPALEWSGVPDGTATGLPEGGGDATLGLNSAGEAAYTGPAPPPDHGNHHYYFWLYALDAALNLPGGMTRRQLHEAIEDHVIEQARLVGTYSR